MPVGEIKHICISDTIYNPAGRCCCNTKLFLQMYLSKTARTFLVLHNTRRKIVSERTITSSAPTAQKVARDRNIIAFIIILPIRSFFFFFFFLIRLAKAEGEANAKLIFDSIAHAGIERIVHWHRRETDTPRIIFVIGEFTAYGRIVRAIFEWNISCALRSYSRPREHFLACYL